MMLGLGTAQIASLYGVANRRTKAPCRDEVREIFDIALGNGVILLDTASAYPGAEEAIGSNPSARWRIVTKLVPSQDSFRKTELLTDLRNKLYSSFERMRVKSVFGVILHDPSVLLQREGSRVFECLLDLREEGYFDKLGVSFGAVEEWNSLTHKKYIDLVQVPINLFDRRFIDSGALNQMKSLGIEIHARSIFLQGSLLVSPCDLPPTLQPWRVRFEAFHNWCRELNCTPIEGAIGFGKTLQEVSALIVGIETKGQLLETFAAFEGKSSLVNVIPDHLRCEDRNLIEPWRWTT